MKEPIISNKTIDYITQYRYGGEGIWFDRIKSTDLGVAKNDLALAKKWAKSVRMKYVYRLIRRETTIKEFVEEE